MSRERDIEVVAEVDGRETVILAVSSLQPDVVVIDDEIASDDEFAVIHAVYSASPSSRTLIMATRPRPCDLRKAVAAHATGFVSKDASPESIGAAIRQVAMGRKALDPDLAFATLDSPVNPMTQRERSVLRLAAAGAPTAEIAWQLCLAAGTVRNHISSVITKLGARNRVDAIRIADSSGWL